MFGAELNQKSKCEELTTKHLARPSRNQIFKSLLLGIDGKVTTPPI